MKSSKFKIQNLLIGFFFILGVVALGGLFTTRIVKAQEANNKPSVIQKLVERFNLNTDEVKGVFNEVYKERQQEMLDRFVEKLSEAVKDGVITEEQKTTLLDKQTEMMDKYEALRQEWQTWATQSGVDFEKLHEYGVGPCGMGLGGKFGGHGFGRGGFRGW